jgi:hypothetical protein
MDFKLGSFEPAAPGSTAAFGSIASAAALRDWLGGMEGLRGNPCVSPPCSSTYKRETAFGRFETAFWNVYLLLGVEAFQR